MDKYDEKDIYLDDEDRKPKLFIIIGLILLVVIIIVIAVSCSITTSKKSSNTNLSYLRINGGVLEPNFSNSKTTYNVLTQNEYVEILCDTESKMIIIQLIFMQRMALQRKYSLNLMMETKR